MTPSTDFKNLVQEMGEVGLQMTRLGYSEGSAGNISVFVHELEGLDAAYIARGELDLPVEAPNLAGGWVIISGTGRRIRDIYDRPELAVCVLHILAGGQKAAMYAARDIRPTIELNSHLGVHNDHVGSRNLAYHAVLHTQPLYITYLSHMEDYQTTYDLNRRILRWQPEMIVVFPEGIEMIPFHVPGSAEQGKATTKGLHDFQAVVWQRHGIVTRSDTSITRAGDLAEYIETAAHSEYLNLTLDEPTIGLTDGELRQVCTACKIDQPYF